MARINQGLFTSNSAEWETPQDLFNRLNHIYNFDIDVCATHQNAKCEKYFTKEQDGLKQEWSPYTCFMNPPYGREISKWVEKAFRESQKGATVVCLLPARTDTKWWHKFVMRADMIYFIKGRLKFGNSKNSAPFPSCIVLFKEGCVVSPVIATWE